MIRHYLRLFIAVIFVMESSSLVLAQRPEAKKHFDSGMLYKEDGSNFQAKEEFLKALKIDPGYHAARVELAGVYADLNMLDEASDELDKLRKVTRPLPKYHTYKGLVNYKQGLEVWTNLVQNHPEYLFKDNGLYSAPAWSPDGGKIALVSTKDGNAEIYVMDFDTKKMQRLTQHPAIDTSPSWSPTGREIVFTSDRLGNPQIFIMDAEGANLRRLPLTSTYNDSPVWSPRGDKIAFVSRGPTGFDIFVYDLTSETATQLTNNAGSNEDPCWSPDGYRLAFSSTRDGRSDIYSMMWDGSDVRRLTYKGTCTSPAWSSSFRPAEEFLCKE